MIIVEYKIPSREQLEYELMSGFMNMLPREDVIEVPVEMGQRLAEELDCPFVQIHWQAEDTAQRAVRILVSTFCGSTHELKQLQQVLQLA